MCSVHIRRAVVPALLAICSHASAQLQHFDVSNDFSYDVNPNGPWAYRMAGFPITGTLSGLDGAPGWGDYLTYDASILRFDADPVSNFWHDAAYGDVIIHVSSSDLYPSPMTITWTAPEAGLVAITGAAWDAGFYPDRDAGWNLIVNGQTVAQRATIQGTYRSDPEASFANNIVNVPSLSGLWVEAGDLITFSTYNITYYGHFMGVALHIRLGCGADFNGDGFPNGDDFDEFVAAFEAGDQSADYNGDGFPSGDDFDEYVRDFEAGC